MIGLCISIFLAVVCALAKWQAVYRVKMVQGEVDLLEAEKERLSDQLREFKDFYDGLEAEKAELTTECREMSRKLRRSQARIEELEGVEKKIEEHHNESPI